MVSRLRSFSDVLVAKLLIFALQLSGASVNTSCIWRPVVMLGSARFCTTIIVGINFDEETDICAAVDVCLEKKMDRIQHARPSAARRNSLPDVSRRH